MNKQCEPYNNNQNEYQPPNRDFYYQEVRNNYNADLRVAICELILRKYRFERYKLSDTDIRKSDLIVTNNAVKNLCQNRINQNYCSQEQLFEIMNSLTIDQLTYIGVGN